MRRIRGQQEHLTFANVDIAKLPIIYSLEQHGTFVLIEPFGCLVYMIIGPLIRATNDLQQISDEKGAGGTYWLPLLSHRHYRRNSYLPEAGVNESYHLA